MALSALIAIGLPVVLFVVFYNTYNARIVPMLMGAAGFVLFVMVLERSLHLMVFSSIALAEKPVLYIMYGSLMAGLFEETARFLSFAILKRKYDGIGTGLAYGIGHGGIESILLVGLAMINTILLSITVNAGNLDTITGGLRADVAAQVNAQLHTVLTTPAHLFLVSGLERVFAISIQLALSVAVFYAVYGKHTAWLYPCAILAHALFDVPAAAMQVGVIKNMVVVEALTGAGAVVSILIAIYIHKKIRTQFLYDMLDKISLF
jgi:uncharacterized membrane protein YhfC